MFMWLPSLAVFVFARWLLSRRLGLTPRFAPRSGSFGQRALVALVGPAACWVVATLLVLIRLLAWGAAQPAPHALVEQVMKGRPADRAGVRAGDLIVSIDGREIVDSREVAPAVDASQGRALPFEIETDGARRTINIQPIDDDGTYRVGIQLAPVEQLARPRAGPAISMAVAWPFQYVAYQLHELADIFYGRRKAEFSGPIGIVQEARGAKPLPGNWILWFAATETMMAVYGFPIALALLLALRPRRA